jgi:hypothetical protein
MEDKPNSKRKPQPKLTRAQITETLKQTPIEVILGTSQPLTSRQREFARKLAEGKMSKRQAYRESYNAKSEKTLNCDPYRLAGDPRIVAEVSAYKLAVEAEKLRNPTQLKALLVQQLVQHSLDEGFPPAQRIKALELIGKLYEVGAFEERKTTTVIHKKSGDIKAQLIERIKQVIDVDTKPVRTGGQSLLDEIMDESGTSSSVKGDPEDPTHGASTAVEIARGPSPIHTVPHIQSPDKLEQVPETTPSLSETK